MSFKRTGFWQIEWFELLCSTYLLKSFYTRQVQNYLWPIEGQYSNNLGNLAKKTMYVSCLLKKTQFIPDFGMDPKIHISKYMSIMPILRLESFYFWSKWPKIVYSIFSKKKNLTFPAVFSSNLNHNCSNLLDMRNLQEQVKKTFCYQKLFRPFTVWINCSSNLKHFAKVFLDH